VLPCTRSRPSPRLRQRSRGGPPRNRHAHRVVEHPTPQPEPRHSQHAQLKRRRSDSLTRTLTQRDAEQPLRSSARYRHWPFRCCSSPEAAPSSLHLHPELVSGHARWGRPGTGDLSPCRTGPTPAEPPRRGASVGLAQGEGNPEGNRRGTEPDSDGRREGTRGRRPKGNQRKAAEGEEPEGRRRETGGKPEGETGGREVRPRTAR
jgi:hypothetical protein